MLSRAIDNMISLVSPKWAAQRMAYRESIARIKSQALSHDIMRQMMSGNQGGYEAGKRDRLKGRIIGSPHENDVPFSQIQAMRWRSWNLHRNSGQARKICRNLGAKVIGPGLSPSPQTKRDDGSPFVEFRQRAREIWCEFVKESDFRGKPGFGGTTLTMQAKTALRAVMLAGGALYRFHAISRTEQRNKGLFLPLQVQLVHVDRLDATKHDGKTLFRGIELDDQGRIVRYWLLPGGTKENPIGESVPVPRKEMGHVFMEEDVDQYLGSPWFGAAMLTMDDRRNYEYSELIAAEMASCLVAGYSRSPGQTGGIGIKGGPLADRDLTDAYGNKIERLSPGMLFDLGTSGKIDVINPLRPNSSAEGFLSHLIRTEAVSVPGVKSSTLTGDYRNSSFSSERSADNDIWPEIEELQSWWGLSFYQPIWEQVITTAALDGQFDEIAGFNIEDFTSRRREYLEVHWQGPVSRSINPRDDAEASRVRVKNATSTPQLENATLGRDWREVLQGVHEFLEYGRTLDIPDDFLMQALGIEQTDTPLPEEPASKDDQEDEQDDDRTHPADLFK